jgi:hypothetical protein
MVRTTNGPARTCRWTKIRRFLVRSRHRAMGPSWQSRKSVDFTIDTSGARPEHGRVAGTRRTSGAYRRARSCRTAIVRPHPLRLVATVAIFSVCPFSAPSTNVSSPSTNGTRHLERPRTPRSDCKSGMRIREADGLSGRHTRPGAAFKRSIPFERRRARFQRCCVDSACA